MQAWKLALMALPAGVFALALVECAGGKVVSLQSALSDMIGNPAATATARLGPADTIRPEAAGTTYIWIAKGSGGITPGHRSNVGAEAAAAIQSGKKTATPRQPCTLVMTTDVHEAIKTFRITGDQSHCEAFSNKIAGK